MYGTITKALPKDDYYLLKSCQAGSWYPSIEMSLRYALSNIGLNYLDDPRQSSCVGCTNHIGVTPMLPIVALNARNMNLAYQSGKPNIICNCPTCYSNLKDCKRILSEDSLMRDRAMEAARMAGIDYNDSVTISHVSEVFLEHLDRIKARAVYSMKGIRAVTHHGCHYYKIYTRDVMAGNFERPMVLDEIAKGLGCKTYDYPERSLCCGLGFHHIMLYPDYTRTVQRRKYSGIIEADPDVLITMCAGCTLSLDMCQEKIMQELGVRKDIPVVNISELMALILGADPHKVVGIDLHAVPIEPLMEKMGIPVGG